MTTLFTRRKSIEQMTSTVTKLFGLVFAARIVGKPHLAHNAGPGPCSKCGCQGFQGSSYICSADYCHHTRNDHQ